MSSTLANSCDDNDDSAEVDNHAADDDRRDCTTSSSATTSTATYCDDEFRNINENDGDAHPDGDDDNNFLDFYISSSLAPRPF
jgi:hypothetical protein